MQIQNIFTTLARPLLHAMMALGVCLFCTQVGASAPGYQYTYTGKPFTTTFISNHFEYPPPYDVEVRTAQERIEVDFVMPTLLNGGANLLDSVPFNIRAIDVATGSTRQMGFPSPYLSLPGGGGGGSVVYPYYIGSFDILATNSAGLPTAWNISIDYNYNAPTGRFTQSVLSTTTSQDSTLGGYEGFYWYTGSNTNNTGTWAVTVVPELQTYLMMLMGLMLMGVALWRQQARARLDYVQCVPSFKQTMRRSLRGSEL